MMRSSAAIKAAAFQGGSSWNKPNIQLRDTCNWGDLSLTRWSRSSDWATAGDRGIGIGQYGNTSSNLRAERNWEMNFLRTWRRTFWRSIASGTDRWRGQVMAGVGMWRSA